MKYCAGLGLGIRKSTRFGGLFKLILILRVFLNCKKIAITVMPSGYQ